MTGFSLGRRVFVMVVVALAMLSGTSTFLTMSRREDPELTMRVALVSAAWPGATAQKVDELVVDVLEGAIQRVDEVAEIRSTSRVGSAFIEVELDKTVDEPEQIWDELRHEIGAVQGALPADAPPPVVNTNFGEVASLCLTLHQVPAPGSTDGTVERPYSDRELEVFAELVEDELETLDSVAGVSLHGLAEERIYVEFRAADWAKLGLSAMDFRRALDDRNIVVASGELETPGGRFLLRSTGELASLEEFDDVVVGTHANGLPRLLGDLPVSVRRGLQDPLDERVRFLDGEHRVDRAVLLAIEMKAGANVVEMGAEVAERVERLRAGRLPPDLAFAVVNDLPTQVDTLVWDFVDNLWQAIAVVLGVALLMMGWRPAVVMATAVPLCMITSLAIVQRMGVELEQFSIASLIIALGMIVDNAIVVSDQTATLLRRGVGRLEAARRGASELAVPILTSTLTTVAAFVPLLTIPGSTGEYISSLPIVVSTTLITSYFVAMMVTPILCFWVMKPVAQETQKPGRVLLAYEGLVRRCLKAKGPTLAVAALLVIGALGLAPLIGNQFFPGGERNQFFVHVRLPFGSTLAQTADVVAQVEDLVLETATTEVDGEPVNRLRNAFSVVGSGGPRLIMTMDPEKPAARYAHMVVNTTDPKLSRPWVSELRERVAAIPGARIDVRAYVLGPPLDHPVEFRIAGPDPDLLRSVGDRVVERMRQVPGVVEPYHDWGNSTYQVEVDIDDQRAQLVGLSNRDVAESLNGLIAGFPLTTFREGDYTVPVMLRLAADERRDLSVLESLHVGGGTRRVPLDAVATVSTRWQPASMARFNRQRAILVGSQVEEGRLSTQVSAAALPSLAELVDELPAGYTLEELGEQKESAESQGDMGVALIYSMALILLVLVAQYDSIAKPAVVLSAVPLALVGALLGLFVTGWPLGFMPMLGIVSLAGVVINNAIILIDFVQTEVASGVGLHDAVVSAGTARMRPIVLTTLTTVGGMIPLALFGGPMWAGMSFAMIFGLAVSTVLTLVVVPTIFVAFAEWFGMSVVPTEEPA